MKTIYCISGLGATAKAFSKLHIDGYRLQVIEWLPPLPNETIEAYAARMRDAIEDENPVLMGLSFGGMMCIEIAKQMPVKKIILVSSIKTKSELPLWMKAVAKTRLHKIAPMRTNSRITRPIQNYFLGTVTADDREVAIQFRRNADPAYVRWAVDKVINWQNSWQHPSTIHIHGNADKMFAIRNVQPTHIIKNGGHFLIMNRADEVSALVSQVL
jgi:pimeloyl-ACP methyl ester carboxylesterase